MSGCRGEIDSDDDIPRIRIRCVGDRVPERVEYIEHGIEEEGVPWAVERGYDDDAVTVAREASVESTLKIGVSVTLDSRVVVHHKQLPNDEPMFVVTDVSAETARKLGSNSARLAKGTPLKPIG